MQRLINKNYVNKNIKCYLKISIVYIFHPGDSSLVHIIPPGRVPVIGRDLHVHFFVWIERKRRENHLLAGCLSRGYITF